MKIIPGRPDLNVAYIRQEIQEAAERKIDIIVFPELCTTGYFVGDLFEDESFLRDVERLNHTIREATAVGIVAIVGTTVLTHGGRGEDGRLRVSNAAVVYAHGRYVGHAVKTLQPNYRIFDDDRHFFSTRKIALEKGVGVEDLLKPISVQLQDGRTYKLGVMLCEDMWHSDYPINPGLVLAQKGAEIIFNLSASPWTWQKNRKRHQIVQDLIGQCAVPFVYVNNTGLQNTGKNFIIFDGSSTIYDQKGQIVCEVPPYQDGSQDFVFEDNLTASLKIAPDDAQELYQAVRCGIKEFFATLPASSRKVVIGLSGGIDSALAAAQYVDVLGEKNVIGINMPSRFSSAKHQAIAAALAKNLGIVYEVVPIQEIVDQIATASGVAENSLAYENIQARVRMEILAARAQKEVCVFSANWNKVEAAFGYGTLYADMAGFLAFEGDLVKREIYQLADYLNREVFRRQAVPEACFTVPPTAELRANQRDPFDYGSLTRRGYHDEMVRSFTEFRRNPEWFLEKYSDGSLEKELQLPANHLKALFPTDRRFVHDLEKHWRMFHRSYFKRIQGPPVLLVSKRAFGSDLRESVLPAHLTRRYRELRADILAKDTPRIAVFGLAGNPPGRHHRRIVEELLAWFDHVFVVPSGNREGKDTLKDVSFQDRKEMNQLNFADLPRVTIDTRDLDKAEFTPAYQLDERYKAEYPHVEVWHAVGTDAVMGGRNGDSQVQRSWKRGAEVWQNLNFSVLTRPGFVLVSDDLPPRSEIIEVDGLPGSSTLIRQALSEGKDAALALEPKVLEYIQTRGLYQK